MVFFFVAPRFHTNQYTAVKKLVTEGHDVSFFVVTREGSEDHSILNPTFIKPNRLFNFLYKNNISKKRKFLIPSLSNLIKIFRNKKPDVVIVRNPHYPYSFYFIMVSVFFKSKIILYTQDPYYIEKVKNRQKFYLLLIKLFNAKWITPVLGDKNNGRILNERIFHIPLPIEAEDNIINKIKKKSTKSKIKVLMVGKFLDWKRHDLLIVAIKEINNKRNNKRNKLHLTIIGECTTKEHFTTYNKVLGIIDKYHLNSIINVKTNLIYKEVLDAYSEHDLFILPSSGETFGVSSLEAMSKGLPVIISTNNGFQYYIKDGFNGYIFSSDNLTDLIDKINLAIDDNNLQRMGINAYKYVMEYFSPEYYYARLTDIIDNW